MRKPIIAANWKLQKTVSEASAFLDAFLPEVKDVTSVEIVIAPVFTALHPVGQRLKGTNVALSAQDVYFEEKGAFTGEVAPHMLVDVGCTYTIIGHSERRQYFGETDESVNRKARTALAAGLKAIVCIGESLAERESGKTNQVLSAQLTGGLSGLDMKDVVVAYEPIWAIGTGVTATPQQAQDTHAFIRGHIASMFGADVAAGVRIQYGGSVKPDNVDELMACKDIDGALVGGAALKPDSFARLVKFKG